jgi:Secretion system C-terminal sorting domain/SprB repeat
LYAASAAAQCTVTISTTRNLLTCNQPSATLTASMSGGTSPYSYIWSNTSPYSDCTVFAAGIYTVTVTSSSGCTATATQEILQNNSVLSNNTFSPENGQICAMGNGSICATSAAPNSYWGWSNGNTGNCMTPTQAGVYTVTITTQNCTATASINVSYAPPIGAISHIVQPTTTCLDINGSVTATASGGTPPYSYSWQFGSGYAPTYANIGIGIYAVVVSDANHCTTLSTVRVNSLNDNNLTVAPRFSTLPTCFVKGVLQPGTTGGTPPYTIGWGFRASFNSAQIGFVDSLENVLPTQGYVVTYHATVTDANGCRNTGEIIVEDTILHFPDPILSQSAPQFNCTTKEITLNVTNGLPGYGYTWASGLNPSTPGGQSNIVVPYRVFYYDGYSVTVTKGTYCSKQAGVSILNTGSLQRNFEGYITPDDCFTQNTGSITTQVNITGNTNPYVYRWNTGATSASLTNVPSGWYSVTASSVGCDTVHRNFYVPEICKVTIQGHVVKDNNSNCWRETTDTPIEYGGYVNIRNTRTQAAHIVYINADGFYTTTVDTGRYEIKYFSNTTACANAYIPACTAVNGIILYADAIQNVYSDQNFYFQRSTTLQPDLNIMAVQETARPVVPRRFNFYVDNNGTALATSTTLTFTHDSRWSNLTMLYNGYAPISSTATSKTWNLGYISPNQQKNLSFTMELPQNTASGLVLDNMISITNNQTDCDQNNNTFSWAVTTSNSFDPNDKTLLNPQNAAGGILNDDAPLNYKIRFQNTGTDTAYSVVIRDTLNFTHLDKSTFKVLGASHPNMQVRFQGANIAVFEFPNINLVDSFRNEPLSHGWLQFSIKPKPNTPLYSVIQNTAAIYFDYNDPVITNTVHTQFVPFLSAEMVIEPSNVFLQVAPNPATDILRLKTDITIERCEIYDVLGRVMQSSGIQNQQINVAHLPKGSYFIKVFGGNGSALARFVKM